MFPLWAGQFIARKVLWSTFSQPGALNIFGLDTKRYTNVLVKFRYFRTPVDCIIFLSFFSKYVKFIHCKITGRVRN